MRIAVVGTGYVGLVTGVCLSTSDHKIVCVDRDAAKIEMLKQGQCPIYEPDLPELIQRGLEQGKLTFTTDLSHAVNEAEVVFIAVDTPLNQKNGEVDLSQVEEAAREIAQAMQSYKVIVIKSTVHVGTCSLIASILAHECSYAFDVVSNPEFLREGTAVHDFTDPNRIVFGTTSSIARNVMRAVYEDYDVDDGRTVWTTLESAEMIKCAYNAFFATE